MDIWTREILKIKPKTMLGPFTNAGSQVYWLSIHYEPSIENKSEYEFVIRFAVFLYLEKRILLNKSESIFIQQLMNKVSMEINE